MVDRDENRLYTPARYTGHDNMDNLAAFAIGFLVALFATSLRMGVGMRIVKFAVRKGNIFALEYHGQDIIHEMRIEFTLSRLMTVINWLMLFPPKRVPVIAEIKFRYDGETRWGYRGVWRDTETIETIVDDICIKSLVIITLHDNKWFPIDQISGEPLPNSFKVEVQLRSQRNGRLLGEPLLEEIIYEEGILTKQDIIVK